MYNPEQESRSTVDRYLADGPMVKQDKGAVGKEIQLIYRKIEDLNKYLAILTQKIEPVLRTEFPEPELDEKEEEISTPLSGDLKSIRGKINYVIRNIEVLTNRVDL